MSDLSAYQHGQEEVVMPADSISISEGQFTTFDLPAYAEQAN
jgi:hypothetical protein